MSNNLDSEIEKSEIGSQASGVALAPRVVLAQIVNGIQIFLSVTLCRDGKTDSSRSCKDRPLHRTMCNPRSCNGRIPDMETTCKVEVCNMERAWVGSDSNNGLVVGRTPRRTSAAGERHLDCRHVNTRQRAPVEVGEPTRAVHRRGRALQPAFPVRLPCLWQQKEFPTPRRSQFSWRLLFFIPTAKTVSSRSRIRPSTRLPDSTGGLFR
jgi:hypothetical protein